MPVTAVECPGCRRSVPIERQDCYRMLSDEKTQFDTKCVCGQQIFGFLDIIA